ncbi:SH3 domain protein, partial [Trypanosoma cruzi]
SPASRGAASYATIGAPPVLSCLSTRRVHMQCARRNQRKSLTAQAPFKKRQKGCRTSLMNADDGSPIHSTTSHQSSQAAHRTAEALCAISHCLTQWSRGGDGAYP